MPFSAPWASLGRRRRAHVEENDDDDNDTIVVALLWIDSAVRLALFVGGLSEPVDGDERRRQNHSLVPTLSQWLLLLLLPLT